MKITKEWLERNNACQPGKDWFFAHTETDAIKVVEKLIAEGEYSYANWTLTRLFTKRQNIQYAIFAAEQVIGIYEQKYPTDDRPRKAIEATKKYLKKPTEENRQAAAYAAYAADAAAYAADAAAYAAYAANAAASAAAYAANAANAAASAAAYAANAAYSSANAADAADAAAYAAASAAAKKELQKKICEYGLKLLEVGNEN